MRGRPQTPRRGARKLDWRDAPLAALDFEATGLDFERDEIISFGVVPVRAGRIVMAESVYRLSRPTVPPSPRSVVVHGLRTQDLMEAPALAETRTELSACLRGRFLLTWYGSVEKGFLRKVFGGTRKGWARRNLDVRLLAIAADMEGQGRAPTGYSLTEVADRYRVPVSDPHHALDDALVTAELFLVLATSLGSAGRSRIQELFRIAEAAGSSGSTYERRATR
jgi:DNA polymerase-3 subunit epsilon